MSEFQKRRAELYEEFPEESKAYESEYNVIAARLAEAERLLRSICECYSDELIGKTRSEIDALLVVGK